MEDNEKNDPDSRLLLGLLSHSQGWDQAALAKAARIAASQISIYYRGARAIPRESLEKVAAGAGFPSDLIDAARRAIRSFRAASRGKSRAHRVLTDEVAFELIALVRLAADVILEPFGRRRSVRAPRPSLRDRDDAAKLWARLERRATPERRLLVEEVSEFRSWALCERICAESIAMAPNHPRQALELAELALQIAELVSGSEVWRWRLQGYAWAHVANAHRVCDEMKVAEQALCRALKLWEAGAPGDPGLLNEALMPWIEAALRMSQRKCPEALSRIEQALVIDSGELRGQILLTKARILETLGDPERSTAVLYEVAPLIHGGREPRLALVLGFNLVADLCHLDRAAEAQPRLRDIRELAERLGEELDLAKVCWLEGKVWAGLGRNTEAQAAFEHVRQVYEARELVYNYALVSMDLALLLLEQGQTARVRALADEMLRIFARLGIHQEALAALQIFCDAARREIASVELARRVLRYLHRAQHDPELAFEA